MQEKPQPVFIIDGSNFLYRAYYSMRPLTTKEGLAVQAVYGFCRILQKLINTYHPQYLVLVWDSKGKTVRHEIYEQYKDSRQAAPSDLYQQKELIQEFADSIGLVQLQAPGVEADDLMFSLAKELEKDNIESILVTSDKDMTQTLSDKIRILDAFKEEFITVASCEEKNGFSISKIPFYFALIGDSSDNIPGVHGIGPKTAQELVKQFDSLENLYASLTQVKSARVRQLLVDSKADAFLSEELFHLRFYEIYLTYASCAFDETRWRDAYPLFERLEFRTLLPKEAIQQEISQAGVKIRERYKLTLVNEIEQLNQLCLDIKKAGAVALDTETNGFEFFKNSIVGISLCVNEGESYYVPFGHKTVEKQLSQEEVVKLLKPILEDKAIHKYLHNAKFDALMLYALGIDIQGITFDTMIAANLVVTDGQKIGLKSLSQVYFDEEMLNFTDVVKKNKYKTFADVPLSLATEYAAADAHQTLRLYHIFSKELKTQGLEKLFYELEMPLMHILYQMERQGVLVDVAILDSINTVVSREIEAVHHEIIDLLGHGYEEVNLNSPKQLEDVLFNYLKLPTVKRTTQRTSYSTDQEVLKDLAGLHPVPGLILKYRELFKLKSTYLDALKEYINVHTGKIHTSYNQVSVSTGRLASSEPNLQNIPVDNFEVRSAFKPRPGYIMLSADYSQIELRVLAYLSQDAALITAFNENKDIHAITAAGLFEVSLAEVTHEQRQIGKRINFSILYGLTAFGLSKDLNIPHALAKTYIERYMNQYPGVVAWMDAVVEQTKQRGYVETLWGRRRYMPGIYENNRHLYDLARRTAINTVAQGTAAELMKWGMIDLEKRLRAENLGGLILLQIHDELVLEVPEAEKERTEQLVKKALESIVQWNIPLIVTTRHGHNWQEITK